MFIKFYYISTLDQFIWLFAKHKHTYGRLNLIKYLLFDKYKLDYIFNLEHGKRCCNK